MQSRPTREERERRCTGSSSSSGAPALLGHPLPHQSPQLCLTARGQQGPARRARRVLRGPRGEAGAPPVPSSGLATCALCQVVSGT